MKYRRRIRAAAVLGIAAAVLIWVPSVSADSDGHTRVIGGVSIVNDATHKPILGLSPLTDGTVVDLAKPATSRLSLRVATAAGTEPRSVAFTFVGASGRRSSHTDSRAPYTVGFPLPADAYTLTVQAYTDARALGEPVGQPLSVRFTVAAAVLPAPPLDVLFVGNSLLGTLNHVTNEDTPSLVGHLAAIAGRSISFTKVIRFGSTLRTTWDSGLLASALNGTRRYDFIVLQEYSTLVATKPAIATNTLLNVYAPAFARSLKPGGRVVLFKNWALVNPTPFRSRAAAKAAIDRNYATLSSALATPNLLAPIGDIFETVISAKGAPYLIVPDGKHPNDNALYLDAVTLYGILFRESPRNLADLYLPGATAAYLRSVAATAIGY